MNPPALPFIGYKWRWASLEPTEGLNEPPVYLGVLRVLHSCAGELPRSPILQQRLAKLEEDLGSAKPRGLHLARDPDRNLLRNSGQYWTALGLLERGSGPIALTRLGDAVATGQLPAADFALWVVSGLELPNDQVQTDTDCRKWREHHITIRPLRLILELLNLLRARDASPHITVAELIDIVIPLAPTASAAVIATAVSDFRRGGLDISGWPKCAVKANDSRMAREFLLFLSHHGLVTRTPGKTNRDDKYCLASDTEGVVEALLAGPTIPPDPVATALPPSLEAAVYAARARRTVQTWQRPGQTAFRRKLLAEQRKCLLTGESIELVLEAAHIRPVEYEGADDPSNGLLMRVDIHQLFDAGKIRISPKGEVDIAPEIAASPTYRALPRRISLPRDVHTALHWRQWFL